MFFRESARPKPLSLFSILRWSVASAELTGYVQTAIFKTGSINFKEKDLASGSPKAFPQEFEIRLGGGVSRLQGIFLGQALFESGKVMKGGD